jgi:hypothetical protein
MLAITLTNDELEKVKLLLHDIKLLQKLNQIFDSEAIELLSFDIIEHLNKKEDYPNLYTNKEISDEEIEKAVNNPMHDAYDFREGAMWYREQLKKFGNTESIEIKAK